MPFDGMQLGRYFLQRLIGSGGMGEVYLAEDTRIKRQVAIKVIRSEMAPYPDAEATREANRLFEREARAIASLDHSHILTLFDFGESIVNDHTLTYMVMPYYGEGSLGTWLRLRSNDGSQALSLEVTIQILEQAADALQYAHNQQIIHQDVKPQNFLIRGWKDAGVPDLLLTDFGIAKFISANSNTSQAIRGTPTYMAPEQWEGHPVLATDQYALAIMMYQLLTGQLPFRGGPGQMMYQHLMTMPVPPSKYSPQLSHDVDSVILQALAKKPEERFVSVSTFAHAFQQASHMQSEVGLVPPIVRSSIVFAPNISDSQFIKENVEAASTIKNPVDKTAFVANQEPVPAINQSTTRSGMTEATLVAPDFVATQHVRKHSKSFLALILLLVFVLLSGSFGMYKFFTSANSPSLASNNGATKFQAGTGTSSSGGNATATSLNATASASVNRSTIATATALAGTNNVNATATAQSIINGNATATAIAAQNNPFGSGTLALNDPLTDNSRGYGWEEGERDSGYCTFTGGAYHTSIPLAGYFHSCLALSTNFSNFAYQVQMTILLGKYGGIVFRADRSTTHFYYFLVDSSGDYYLKVYFDKFGDSRVVTSGTSSALSATNLLGVVAQGSTISLYINQQLITTVSDSTFTSGQVGIVTLSGEAAFTDAKVWTI
ncbi:MAG TPA: serine/threonine-protein kinase [Ktedonobacteraceae bacterium]|nr:serine/threonine-protein kinase [Ktedonobacteraceae bacterium]